MKTVIKKAAEGPGDINEEQLLTAEPIIRGARLLKRGQVVAFPTETVYGLGAAAGSQQAVKKIFAAKGRPADNPLIVHISDKEQLVSIINDDLNRKTEELLSVFWPGPLTVIFSRSDQIPDITTAGRKTVAVRMPSHPVARALINKAGLPVAAPSANTSGYPSPTRADHVYQDLNGKIPLIIDGGPCPVGIESTVLDLSGSEPVILRPGAVTAAEISRIITADSGKNKKIATAAASSGVSVEKAPPAPGMKYRHYSPETPVIIVDFSREKQLLSFIQKRQYRQPVLLLSTESCDRLQERKQNSEQFNKLAAICKDMGSRTQPEEIARNLFSLLREHDRSRVDVILVEAIPERGIGEAVMNRLSKAAREEVKL